MAASIADDVRTATALYTGHMDPLNLRLGLAWGREELVGLRIACVSALRVKILGPH